MQNQDGIIRDDLPSGDPARLTRILDEFSNGFEVLSRIGPAISIFGSARVKPDDRFYNIAYNCWVETRDMEDVPPPIPERKECKNPRCPNTLDKHSVHDYCEGCRNDIRKSNSTCDLCKGEGSFVKFSGFTDPVTVPCPRCNFDEWYDIVKDAFPHLTKEELRQKESGVQ